jgi:hypothetical protein
LVADLPLPGSASRFDNQSLEPDAGRLFISHNTTLGRLYVAAESGVVAVFAELDGSLTQLGWYRTPWAHTVAVDPETHRVYLPLADLGGHPVLRVLAPSDSR